MGACDFETVAFGKTARDAFNSATDSARYEYGHGGYTGSIAEKDGFVVIDRPKARKTADLVRWIASVQELDDDPQWITPVNKEYDRRVKLADGRKFDIAKDTPKPLWGWVIRHAATYHSKYGAALCMELSYAEAMAYKTRRGLKGKQGSVFAFFGIAAE